MKWELSIIPKWNWKPYTEETVCDTTYRWLCFRFIIENPLGQEYVERINKKMKKNSRKIKEREYETNSN